MRERRHDTKFCCRVLRPSEKLKGLNVQGSCAWHLAQVS